MELEKEQTKEEIPGRGVLPQKKFNIVIQNEACAAWMAINNTFTAKDLAWSEYDSYWNGVLIQPGVFKPWKYSQPQDPLLDRIEIHSEGGGVTRLSRGELQDGIVWINVVVENSDIERTAPIKPEDFFNLYLHPFDPRSLHQYLVPFPGGITFWHPRATVIRPEDGPAVETAGYSMVAGPAENHSSFTFSVIGDKVEVTIYRFPVLDPFMRRMVPWRQISLERMTSEPVLGAKQLVLVATGGGDDPGTDNPPQRPGG